MIKTIVWPGVVVACRSPCWSGRYDLE